MLTTLALFAAYGLGHVVHYLVTRPLHVSAAETLKADTFLHLPAGTIGAAQDNLDAMLEQKADAAVAAAIAKKLPATGANS